MTTDTPIIEHPGSGLDQLSDLSLDATTVSGHDLKFLIQGLLNHLTVYMNWNSEKIYHVMQAIGNKIRNLREEEAGTILQQEPSTLNEAGSGFVFDASEFGSEPSQSGDQPLDWTTNFSFDDLDISVQELMNYWIFFRNLDNQMKQKIAEMLTEMGRGIRHHATE